MEDQTQKPVTELNGYSFDEFLCLEDKDEQSLYKSFGLAAKAKDWDKGDILDWPWSRVKNIQDVINKETVTYSEMTEVIVLASELPVKTICRTKWHEVFAFYNFVVESIKRVNELEKQLSYEPSARELSAGIERYDAFGWFVTLDRLAGGDMLKYEAIGNLKYCDVFAKLKLNKVDREFNERLLKRDTDV